MRDNFVGATPSLQSVYYAYASLAWLARFSLCITSLPPSVGRALIESQTAMATGREFKEPISFEGARVRYRLQWRSTVTISTRWMESEKEYQSGEEVIKAKRQAEIDRAEDQVEFRAVRWVERIVWEEQVLEGEE